MSDAILDDDTAMLLALKAARKSGCRRANVGAVAVGETSATIGYNGSGSANTCYANGCTMKDGSCVRYRHAEEEAFSACTDSRVLLLAVTHSPCFSCFEYLVRNNVKKIIFLRKYRYDEFMKQVIKSGLIYEVDKRLFQFKSHVSRETFKNKE